MNINERLYVEIVPLEGDHPPRPHPVTEAHFDPRYVYKVLGMYNPSETSECYLILANRERELWFVPQRHLRAYKLIDSDEFFLTKDAGDGAARSDAREGRRQPSASRTP
jgi:hypothetical protein